MAATYNGVSFYVLAEEKDGTLSRPLLVPTDFGVQRVKIPYANREQVQFSGRGNSRFELKCEVYDLDDFNALAAMVAVGQGHTLENPFGDSENFTNMYFMEMKDVWRVTFQVEIHFTAVFERLIG